MITGLHAVGDSVCTTNPTFGRGVGMGLRCAADLADTLDRQPDDPHTQALDMARAVDEHVAPWFADQAATDAARLAMLRRTVLTPPAAPVEAPPDPGVDRITFGQLRQAAQVDAVAFRAAWRIMGMVGTPAAVYENPEIIGRVRGVLAGGAPPSMPQPTRAELEAALLGVA